MYIVAYGRMIVQGKSEVLYEECLEQDEDGCVVLEYLSDGTTREVHYGAYYYTVEKVEPLMWRTKDGLVPLRSLGSARLRGIKRELNCHPTMAKAKAAAYQTMIDNILVERMVEETQLSHPIVQE